MYQLTLLKKPHIYELYIYFKFSDFKNHNSQTTQTVQAKSIGKALERERERERVARGIVGNKNVNAYKII